jgi:hypothetical protein
VIPAAFLGVFLGAFLSGGIRLLRHLLEVSPTPHQALSMMNEVSQSTGNEMITFGAAQKVLKSSNLGTVFLMAREGPVMCVVAKDMPVGRIQGGI